MKMGPFDAEYNYQSTGTNENNTTTQKTTKTKEKLKTKQKTKTAQKTVKHCLGRPLQTSLCAIGPIWADFVRANAD